MTLARRLGFILIAVAAVFVAVAMAPATPEPVDADRFDRLIDQALADFESNESRTQGAPQQQVVNGWVARDLLTVISQQNNALLAQSAPAASDERVPMLLMLAVLAIAWHGLTQRPGDPTVVAGDAMTFATSSKPEESRTPVATTEEWGEERP